MIAKCYVFLRHPFHSTFHNAYVYSSDLYYILSLVLRCRELSVGFGLGSYLVVYVFVPMYNTIEHILYHHLMSFRVQPELVVFFVVYAVILCQPSQHNVLFSEHSVDDSVYTEILL